jgi:hypothetical protein
VSEQDFGILLALVVAYTAIFDVIDLQPQVGSVRFLASFTYLFYLLFRVLLATLASVALHAAIDPAPAIYLVALLGTLSGVTILQNFALNVGGTDIANVSALGEKYKARMITEESERHARGQRTTSLLLQRELSLLKSDYLRRELRRMYLSVDYTPDQANKQISSLEQVAEIDSDLRTMLASRIATINPEYADLIIRNGGTEQKADPADDERPVVHAVQPPAATSGAVSTPPLAAASPAAVPAVPVVAATPAAVSAPPAAAATSAPASTAPTTSAQPIASVTVESATPVPGDS